MSAKYVEKKWTDAMANGWVIRFRFRKITSNTRCHLYKGLLLCSTTSFPHVNIEIDIFNACTVQFILFLLQPTNAQIYLILRTYVT
jgi:hypothetical protein